MVELKYRQMGKDRERDAESIYRGRRKKYKEKGREQRTECERARREKEEREKK